MNVMARSGQRYRQIYRPCLLLRVSRNQDEVTEKVVVDDESVAKMSGGDVDVEPYLNSRNTIGHGTATQILKAQSGKSVSECETIKQWWLRKVVVVWETRQKRPPV